MRESVWTVGAGGLLGQSVVATLGPKTFASQKYSWLDLPQLSGQFSHDAQRFSTSIGQQDSIPSWAILWVAGRGIVGASRGDLEQETHALRALIQSVQANRPAGRGTVFFASSAGAVYAGSAHPPFTESSDPVATSDYGHVKLEQEGVIATAVSDGIFDVGVIGRIANVYGAGQNLIKPQGLVTHLCLAAAKRTSVNLFVPLDTRRHYIDARDAASQILASCDAVQCEPDGTCRVKIISAGTSVTVGEVVATVRRVARRPVRVATGIDGRAVFQASDLRLSSQIWPEIGCANEIGLPVGVYGVMRDIDSRFAGGILVDKKA